MEITLDIAKKVLATVDAGLVNGVGEPKPGSMCVEADPLRSRRYNLSNKGLRPEPRGSER